MKVRKATEKEMLCLWGYQDTEPLPPTALLFAWNLFTGNAEFWALEDNGRIIGELYVFWKLEDQNFADGKTRAYLCAFRVQKEYRGKGCGSLLMREVLQYLKDKGVRAAAIGVDATEERNIRMYRGFGFTSKIKDCFEDPCDLDDEMNPKACPCFWLLEKSLA